ncbi:MAG: lamin tail domain-containing protein, partial [Deltaproteobacteria bacterium]|nr:lamin tail domain-containing protein [Deltaproteobacteria bacterium]
MSTRTPLVVLPWLAVPGLLLAACGSPDTGRPPGACESGLLAGDLVISEVMVDPAGADAGREWFEIYNATPNELSLSGVLLLHSREDGTDAKVHEIGRAWMLPSDDYGVAGELVDDEDVLAALPYIDYGYGDELGSMRNAAGRLVVSCGDQIIDEALYFEPTQGASRSFTGDRAPQAADNDDLALWCDSTSELDSESFGTPGAVNDICIGTGGPLSCLEGGQVREARAPVVGDVVITEVLANPEASEETDGEWFEVYIGADIDLNGLAVGTDPTGLEADPVASNDCMPVAAGTRLVFAREMDTALNGGLPVVDQQFGFSLRNSDGQLVLSYAGEVLDEFAWDSTPAGATLNLDPDFRTPEDNDDPRYVCPATTPYGAGDLGSPGEANEQCPVPPPEGQCLDGDTFRDAVLPQPGDLVVTELLPNPDAVGDTEGEWFEIRAESAFDLNGLLMGREEGVGDVRIETESCLPIAAGSYAVFARDADPTVNGNLPLVDAVFDFSLINSDGLLWIGTDEATLDVVTWSSSSGGASLSLDPAATNPDDNDDEA